MEFRDYAAKETSALMIRLLAGRSEAGLETLGGVRDALARALSAAEAALQTPPDVETDLQELVRRLNHAASAAVRATAQRIQEDAAATLLGVQTELDAERTRADELSAQLAETQAHISGAQAQIAALRADLQHESTRAADAGRAHGEALRRLEQVEAERAATEASYREETEARAAAEDQLRETRGRLQASLTEAADLTRRLEAQTSANEALATELAETRAARNEIEAALASAEAVARAREEALGRSDDELRALQQTLDESIAEAARLTVQAESAAAEGTRLAAELSAAREQVARLEGACAAAEVHGREQSEARAAAEHELQILRRSLEDAIADAARQTVRLEDAAREHAELGAQLDAMRAENDRLRLQQIDLEVERDSHAARVDALEAVTTDQAARITELEVRLDALTRSEAALREQVHSRQQAHEGERGEAESLRGELDQLAILFDSTLHAADQIARCATIADALAALVHQLAAVYPRVAMFRVRGNHLEGEAQVGFDPGSDMSKLVVPMTMDSPLARAASRQAMETIQGGTPEQDRHIPFGTSASSAIALPIVVRGDTLAVVYAEEPAETDGSAAVAAHATFAGLMGRHTVALIMRLTDELKALSELTDYARLLLQEAGQMHAADLEATRSPDEIRRRLKDSIDCAQQLFSQRAALEGPAASRLLDDQMAAAIDGEPDSPFARDLAAVLGRPSARRAAEAS